MQEALFQDMQKVCLTRIQTMTSQSPTILSTETSALMHKKMVSDTTVILQSREICMWPEYWICMEGFRRVGNEVHNDRFLVMDALKDMLLEAVKSGMHHTFGRVRYFEGIRRM